MGFNDYKGDVTLISGLKPESEGYPLMQTCDIQAEQGEPGKPGRRLDALLNELRDLAMSGVGSGKPIPVYTEAKMNAILNAATAENIGTVYKYEGETTDMYESGMLYIITDVLPDGDEVSY
jgi:hypothetical protein